LRPDNGLAEAVPAADDAWLPGFRAGDQRAFEQYYRQHFSTVDRAIGTILSGADRETAIHEVFARLWSSAELRQQFRGGSFAAWLATVARHQAIDVRRRLGREVRTGGEEAAAGSMDWEQAAVARLLVAQFRSDHLPPEWEGVFELRFLQQLPQREAAARLSIRRTTLAYRELRIRRVLKLFLLNNEAPP